MNIRISAEIVDRGRDVAGLIMSAVADLVEQAPQPVVIGVFAGSKHVDRVWVRRVEIANDPQQVAVFAFETSAASCVKRELWRCEREREEQLKKLKQRAERVATARINRREHR